jgi:hypothetical protein
MNFPKRSVSVFYETEGGWCRKFPYPVFLAKPSRSLNPQDKLDNKRDHIDF